MIGIFGGTFDPIHYGHLRSALEVKEIFGLTEVRLIPSAQPPHREQPAATALMRLQMLELAVKNQPGLIIDTRELNRNGVVLYGGYAEVFTAGIQRRTVAVVYRQ